GVVSLVTGTLAFSVVQMAVFSGSWQRLAEKRAYLQPVGFSASVTPSLTSITTFSRVRPDSPLPLVPADTRELR
ncbi:MAG: hypothetical protein ACI379_07575, partial [Nocardioides sp.]|uniref:hypothetical protein n=1 Tax=Nocardioides sp. TaxID=35761 RepID=UPI003F0C7C88